MIRMMLLLVLLTAAGAIVITVLNWMRRRAKEQRLRDNPPALARLLVRLPGEADRSNIKMTRFFGRLERILPPDDKAVEANSNVIHMALVGIGQDTGQTPKVQFMLWCSPELVERVQLDLVECYDGQAQILELKEKDDPFLGYVNAVQAHNAYEQAVRDHEAQLEAARQAQPDADEDPQEHISQETEDEPVRVQDRPAPAPVTEVRVSRPPAPLPGPGIPTAAVGPSRPPVPVVRPGEVSERGRTRRPPA